MLDFINENILGVIIAALGGSGFLVWTFYKVLIKVVLNDKNIDEFGNAAKKYVEKIPDKDARLITRKKLAFICCDILIDLGFGFILSGEWNKKIINKTFLILFAALLCGSAAHAASIDLGYNDSNGFESFTAKANGDMQINGLGLDLGAYYKNADNGTRFEFFVSSGEDFIFNPNIGGKNYYFPMDYFADATYTDDSRLDIDRMDFKIGVGYDLYRDFHIRHKISYALVARDERLLHSFRYKGKLEFGIYKAKLIIFNVLPKEEMSIDLDMSAKITDRASFVGSYKYNRLIATQKESYSKMLGLKLKF
jgi:hypothetical protein